MVFFEYSELREKVNDAEDLTQLKNAILAILDELDYLADGINDIDGNLEDLEMRLSDLE
jgi:hypothetical protein